MGSSVGGDHSSESLGKDSIFAIQLGMAVGRLPSIATFLFKGAMLLGMLLAISGAASPWGGESGSQIESRPSSFLAARDGVRSIMKRATGDEENNGKKKKMGNSKSKKGRGKKERRVKKRKNPTKKKSEKNKKK